MNIEVMVKKIIDGTILEEELLDLIEQRLLLTKHDDKTIIDYILEYKRNTESFDDMAIYNSDIAIKYIDYGLDLSPYISEEIFLSKYNEKQTILEKYLKDICDREVVNKIAELINEGKNLKEILSYRYNNRTIYEYLSDKGDFVVFDIIALNDERIIPDLINDESYIEYIENYVFNKNVLSLKVNDDERIADVILLRIFKDKSITEELKQYINDDMSINIKALEDSNLDLLAKLEKDYSEEYEMLKKTLWWEMSSLKYLNNPPDFYQEIIIAGLSILDLCIISNMNFELEYHAQYNPEFAITYAKYPRGGIVLEYASQEFLETEYNGMPIYEYLVMNRIKCPKFDDKATYDKKVALIYAKHARWDILRKASGEVLETKYKGHAIVKYIYIYMYVYMRDKKMTAEEFVETFNELKKLSKKGYRTISAEAANAGLNIDLGFFYIALSNESFLLEPFMGRQDETKIDNIIKQLLIQEKINLLNGINPTGKLLTYKSKYLGDKMIIEYILEMIPPKTIFADISAETFLYKLDTGITLIDYLVQNYKAQIGRITNEYPNVFRETTIATILNNNGIKLPDINIVLSEQDKKTLYQNIDKIYYPQVDLKELSPEEIELISIFREEMSIDGKSDSLVIDLACNLFAIKFKNKIPYASRDLKSLINIKRQHPEFCLKLGNKTSFSRYDNTVYITYAGDIEAINHEFVHAIHYYARNFEYPKKFELYMNLSQEQIDKILKLASKIYCEFVQNLKNIVIDKDIVVSSNGYYADYLEKIKKDLAANSDDSNYQEGVIQCLKTSPITAEEFEEYFKRVVQREMKYRYSFNQYNGYIALEDIFDALSTGAFFSGKIRDKANKKYFFSGHGQDYYHEHISLFDVWGKEQEKLSHPETSFLEVLAQYVEILNSPKSSEVIGILVDIMGQDFVDMLSEFYDNLYVDDKGYEHVEGGSRHGP